MLNDNWDKIDDAIGDLPGTLAEMGLSQYGSVADAVNKLADFGNWYVWSKVKYGAPRYGLVAVGSSGYIGHSSSTTVYQVADSVRLNAAGTDVEMVNPTNVTFASPSYLEMESGMRYKYVKFVSQSSGTNVLNTGDIYYFGESATFTRPSGQNYIYGGNYSVVRYLPPAVVSSEMVFSPVEDAYPQDGYIGEYRYIAEGNIFTGQVVQKYEYTGTGTYGQSHPTEWHFAHKPSIIVVNGYVLLSAYNVGSRTPISKSFYTPGQPGSPYSVEMYTSDDGLTMYLYSMATSSNQPALKQFNNQGTAYKVIAFG